MSELTKKRVHWTEYNGDELLHDEDVDILTSADAVTFDDGEDLQHKYTQGQFVSPSVTGSLTNLNTTNKSTLVDAINEVKSNATSNESSIGSLTNRVLNAESDIDNLENRVTPISLGGTGATTANEALSALGGASTDIYTATISTTWQLDNVPYMQRIDIDGIAETDVPIVDVVLDADKTTALAQLEAWGCVSQITTGDGYILVTCLEEKPSIEIPIQLKVVR